MMMYLCGVHPEHYHDDRLPVYFSHTPAGTSLQNLLHLGQLVESGKMSKWDFLTGVYHVGICNCLRYSRFSLRSFCYFM